MDHTAYLKYGTETVKTDIKGARSVEVLNPDPMPEIEDLCSPQRRQCCANGQRRGSMLLYEAVLFP